MAPRLRQKGVSWRLQLCANPVSCFVRAFAAAGGERQDMGTLQVMRCKRGRAGAQTIDFGALRELVGLVEQRQYR